MQTRLASWKNRLLNKPGRLTLASSVLSSIPSYYMQIAWLPQSICDSIDQTTRNFIWRDSNNKGIHLVGWNKISRPKNQGGLGIRTARETNICLLGKLVWDLLQSSPKLWVDLLSNRYVYGHNILHATSHPKDSPTWSSIMHAKNALKDGFTWRAGFGNSSFWFYPWSSLGFLGFIVPYIDIHDLHWTVRDVFSTNAPHTRDLYSHLPTMAADFINNTHIKFNPSIEDVFIWSSNKNGVYTTKCSYKWLQSRTNMVIHSNTVSSWSWIWKLKLPEKHKFLFWLACHNYVPTLLFLNHRNIAPSPLCSRCGLEDETFLHCVRDCNFSSIIWHHVGFHDMNFFANLDVIDWLKEGSTGPHSFLFAATVWWAWCHRNLMCLSNDNWPLCRLSYNIHSMVDSFISCFATTPIIVSDDIFIKWNNDNHSAVILNVDGSCLGTPLRAGFGGVVRNDAGFYLSGFSGYIHE